MHPLLKKILDPPLTISAKTQNVQMGLFADDAVFYFGVIKDCNDAESLQQDLNTLVH